MARASQTQANPNLCAINAKEILRASWLLLNSGMRTRIKEISKAIAKGNTKDG